jgi:hypothetical protein
LAGVCLARIWLFLISKGHSKKTLESIPPLPWGEEWAKKIKKNVFLWPMVYSIAGPICLPPTGGIVPYQRLLPQRVEPVIEVSYEETGLNFQNGEKASNYDRQGNLEIRQPKGLFIDEVS